MTPHSVSLSIDIDREEAAREARRPKLYRCSDRMCGGLDCATCYGESAASDYLESMNDTKTEEESEE